VFRGTSATRKKHINLAPKQKKERKDSATKDEKETASSKHHFQETAGEQEKTPEKPARMGGKRDGKPHESKRGKKEKQQTRRTRTTAKRM